MSLRVVGQGVVFRNPRPELHAVHAWHPSLVDLGGGRWLCSFDLGSAPESLDYATYLSRSQDDGVTWSEPVRLLQTSMTERRTTHTLRLARLRNGVIVAGGARFFRDDPNHGLINTPGLGYTPMELITTTSGDDGATWTEPVTVAPPLEGPAFESCSSVVELNDGRLLWPTSTWMGWDGSAPNGMKSIALVSDDRGATWPRFIEIFDRWSERVLHWEVSVVQLKDGSLLSLAWAVDTTSGSTEPTPYAWSRDAVTFSERGTSGISGQTAKLLALPDGRAFCAYRRHDIPGLWATAIEVDADGNWHSDPPDPLWQGAASGMRGEAGSVGEDLSALLFGYPNPQLRADGEVMLAFWCRESCVGEIRWMRLTVS